MNTSRAEIRDFSHRGQSLLSDEFEADSLTLEYQVLLEAHAERLQDKFGFKQLL